MKTITIVGDKFAEFAEQSAVLCAREFEELLSSNDPALDGFVFELGQGVGVARVERLLELAHKAGRREQLLFESIEPCGSRHVHKVRSENALISVPRRVSESSFEAALLLDDDCELLADHVAGKHLQGMVLIEAARQMCLAVTEEFFTSRFTGGCAFLWSAFSIRFNAYAFPLKLTVEYVVHDHAEKGRANSFDVEVSLVQAGAVVAVARVGFDIRDRAATERREASLALAAAGAA